MDVARSAQQAMGIYPDGVGPAFSTAMKLYHLGKRRFLPAQALLVAQGMDPIPVTLSGVRRSTAPTHALQATR